MNYKKFAQDNQKVRGYKIIKMNKNSVVIQCNECGAIRTCKYESLYRYKDKPIHNLFCSAYYMNLARKEIGIDEANHFHDFYRMAKYRCINPKNKDYKHYKGKFKFKDYVDYHKHCYELYKNAINGIDYKKLSIDRIDNTKGYEADNIRFVTMKENLQNRSCVKGVKLTNIETGETIIAKSAHEASLKLVGTTNVSGSITKNAIRNTLYRQVWKIEYYES